MDAEADARGDLRDIVRARLHVRATARQVQLPPVLAVLGTGTLTAEASISELAAAYVMSFAAVQKHVAVLEGAGLVTKDKRGRERIVRGNPEQIRRAQALLDQYEQIWRARIDRLDALLAEDN